MGKYLPLSRARPDGSAIAVAPGPPESRRYGTCGRAVERARAGFDALVTPPGNGAPGPRHWIASRRADANGTPEGFCLRTLARGGNSPATDAGIGSGRERGRGRPLTPDPGRQPERAIQSNSKKERARPLGRALSGTEMAIPQLGATVRPSPDPDLMSNRHPAGQWQSWTDRVTFSTKTCGAARPFM